MIFLSSAAHLALHFHKSSNTTKFWKNCKVEKTITTKLLQNYCNEDILQVSSKVTIFKNYLSNTNFI